MMEHIRPFCWIFEGFKLCILPIFCGNLKMLWVWTCLGPPAMPSRCKRRHQHRRQWFQRTGAQPLAPPYTFGVEDLDLVQKTATATVKKPHINLGCDSHPINLKKWRDRIRVRLSIDPIHHWLVVSNIFLSYMVTYVCIHILCILYVIVYLSLSGWWFGTFFIFHFIYGLSSFPLTFTPSFFKMGTLHHQPDTFRCEHIPIINHHKPSLTIY